VTILVAVGDDDSYESVLTVALRLATGLDQDLQVTHITETDSASGDERAFRDDIRAVLEETTVPVEVDLAHLDRGGLRPGTTIGKQLIELAADVGVDHVVVGHHSKDRLTAAREGHTDFVLAEGAAVPVTIVPEAVD
jgi:K+-sensing histidine kinase KdpD